MGAEGQSGVEGHPKDFGVLLEWEGGLVEGNDGVGVQLMSICAEEGVIVSFLSDNFLNEESESVETDEGDDYDESYLQDVQEAEWSDSSEEDD